MSPGVLGLFKFGASQYIEDFRRGRLYMKPLTYFRQLEGDAHRGDPNEGATWSIPAAGAALQVEVDGRYCTIAALTGALRFARDADLTANVFCMYALRRKHTEPLVDPRNLTFGDTFAVLRDGDEFLRRVRSTAAPDGHRVEDHLVEYVDPDRHSGAMGAFRKFRHFEWQSEFRVAVLPGTGEDFVLEVGDLSDLVLIGPLETINRQVRLA
jgi:hypothetical protein